MSDNETFAQGAAPGAVPLIVDLDGTLINTDMLVEAALAYLSANPLRLFTLILWTLQGKATLKHKLAGVISLDPAILPYNGAVLERIKRARAEGQPVYLVSASHETYVEGVARHLDVFSGWIGSNARTNLAGAAKADHLVTRFGKQNFDYIGNAPADLHVWRQSRLRIAANTPRGLLNRLRRDGDAEHLGSNTFSWKACLRLLRPHQWVKNALLVVPMAAAHTFTAPAAVAVILALISFSLSASATYIVNDLFDLQADRGHPSKRKRPLAAGTVSIPAGIATSLLLLAAGFAIGWFISPRFVLVLLVYCAVTLAYSLYLKRKMMIDVVALAGLYAIRLVAGAAAIDVPISEWLLAFAMFFFLSLALMKRYSEMALRFDSGLPNPDNRNYKVTDLPVLSALSAAAGYAAIIVFALYIANPATRLLYSHPQRLYLACPILIYWISRALMLSHRRLMHDDPVVFALKDPNSLIAFVIIGLVGASAV